MLQRKQRLVQSLFVLLFFLLPALACNLPGQQATPESAQQALAESIAGTQTAAALEEAGTNELATAQAAASQTSQVVAGTQTAIAASRDESQLATATIVAPILAELPLYNVDATQGRAAWVHPPVRIELQGKNQIGYANDYMQTIVADFVMAADITWDTQYGTSGCGFMFRSDGDKNKPNQYMVLATRLGNGHIIFSALANGELANVHDFYPRSEDKSFSAENGSTNRLAVVGRGTLIEIYSNGVKVGEVDTTLPPAMPKLPPKPVMPTNQNDPKLMDHYRKLLQEYKELETQVNTNYNIALGNYKKTKAVFDKGFVAMIAASESGKTICEFNDAWLWLIEE